MRIDALSLCEWTLFLSSPVNYCKPIGLTTTQQNSVDITVFVQILFISATLNVIISNPYTIWVQEFRDSEIFHRQTVYHGNSIGTFLKEHHTSVFGKGAVIHIASFFTGWTNEIE
jgi:hypothetical protein